DPLFWKSVGNTFSIWFLSTIPQLVVALFLAFFLNQAFLKGKGLFRLAIFMPNVTSVVAVALVFSAIFGTDYGIVNYLLSLVGIDAINWKGSYFGTHIAIAVMVMWRWVGYNAIIYLAGLQSISKDLYEAATIDGASKFQQIIYIDRKSTRLNSSHVSISYAVFCLKKNTAGTNSPGSSRERHSCTRPPAPR